MREELKKYIICMDYIESHPELKEEYEQYIIQKEEEEICERGLLRGRYEERKRIIKELVDLGWSLEKIKETLGFNPGRYL